MKRLFNIFVLLFCVFIIQAQQLDRSIQPSAAPAKTIEIKDAKTFTLANGLKVFVVEDNRVPIVYYSFNLDIKPALEKDKAGLSNLFAEVMGTTTKTRSKEQINKEIDLIGARLAAGAKGGYISCLKKYETKGLELVSDLLLNPVFNQKELDLAQTQYQSALASLSENVSEINKRVSSALVYGKNFPDGEVETLQTIQNVTSEDLKAYYDIYFAPNITRLVIIGDITEAEARKNAEKYFGKWQKKDVPVAQYTIPTLPQSTSVNMVEKPGAVQSAVDVTYPIDLKIGANDEIAAKLANYILGGGSSSHLFQNLREKHSYTYGVYSVISQGELVSRFYLTAGRGGAASVKSAATDNSVYQILSEMKMLADNPISVSELKNAKAFFAGDFGRSLEESSTIARFAINIDKYNLPKDFYKNYLKKLDAVTIADIQAASQKYIKPKNAIIVVTGDKSHAEGLKQFSANGTVTFYDMDAEAVKE